MDFIQEYPAIQYHSTFTFGAGPAGPCPVLERVSHGGRRSRTGKIDEVRGGLRALEPLAEASGSGCLGATALEFPVEGRRNDRQWAASRRGARLSEVAPSFDTGTLHRSWGRSFKRLQWLRLSPSCPPGARFCGAHRRNGTPALPGMMLARAKWVPGRWWDLRHDALAILRPSREEGPCGNSERRSA